MEDDDDYDDDMVDNVNYTTDDKGDIIDNNTTVDDAMDSIMMDNYGKR